MKSRSPIHSILLLIALLTCCAKADKFPFADGTFDKHDKLTLWSLEKVRTYRNETIGKLIRDDGKPKSIPEKDAAANPEKIKGYPSPKVEDKNFTTELDLTEVKGLVYVAIHVDDEAYLAVTEIDDTGKSIGIPIEYELKGSALWRAERSYKEFSNPIPAGHKYKFDLKYRNTTNLTDKYDGLVDYDGVNVFLMHHPAVDLDVDSNNDEGFDFKWGSDPEDKIEADPSLPGKIIAVPIEPDADHDGIADYKDFGGITPGPEKQFVQMVVHLPPNYDPETASVTFGYPMSATISGSPTETPNSGFRIWTKNGHAARSLDAIPAAPPTAPNPVPGYLVKDGDPIPWKNLAANCEKADEERYPGPALILYLETVITYKGGSLSASQPEQIKVIAKNGSTGDESKTEDLVNITVRCTGGVKLSGPKAIVVNDNHHNRDASGNQIDQWDYTNDRTGTLDPDVLPIAIEVTALDQDVWVTLSSEAMKGLGEPGTPATGGLIDGVFPGESKPSGTASDPDGQSKKGWKAVPYTFKVDKKTTFKQNLYIEGQRHSATIDDVVIKLETTGKDIETGTEKTCIATTDAEHKMTVYQVDLDIDSDNDSGYIFGGGTSEEDKIEFSKSLPGKVIIGSLNVDNNGDGIVDYENGVDGKPVITGLQFTPLQIKLAEPYDIASARVVLKYPSAEIGASKSGIRIWRKNGNTSRITADDLILSGTPINWSTLTGAGGSRVQTIYIETINSLSAPLIGKHSITATVMQADAINTVDDVNIVLLGVEFITPAGDPVTAPIDANSLTTSIPDGANEYTFSNDNPSGLLKMKLKVKVPGIGSLSAAEQAKFKFDLDSIGNSVLSWNTANPSGRATVAGDFIVAEATYTGLPENNADFGTKYVSLRYSEVKVSTEDFEVFFHKNGLNHPNPGRGLIPNWFHYWKNGSVCGIPNDAEYDFTAQFGYTLPEQDRIVRLGPLAATRNTGPETFYGFPNSTYGSVIVTGTGVGIKCVAETVVHENHHITLYEKIKKSGDDDQDGDKISDSDEPTLNGINSDLSNPDTYGLRFYDPGYSNYGDNELRCRKIETTSTILIYPNKDWANPGCQSSLKFGP